MRFFLNVFCWLCLGAGLPILAHGGNEGNEKGAKDGNRASQADFVEGEILVKLKDGAKINDLGQGMKNAGLFVARTFKSLGGSLYVVKTDSKNRLSLLENIKALKNDPSVQVAEPNYIYSIIDVRSSPAVAELPFTSTAPNDPMFDKLWGLKNTGNNEPTGPGGFLSDRKEIVTGVAGADINALAAWDVNRGDRKIKIAIIDTGIDYTHPDLLENMWENSAEKKGKSGVDDDGNGYIDDVYGYDFANNRANGMDDHGHGTHCAGTIGAIHDNGIGVAGVMAHATLVPVKFLSAAGSGTTEGAIQAIDYATGLNVDIMSNSWGGGGFSDLLRDSIVRAKDKGIIFVAAAGNSSQNNDEQPNYPSNYPVENVVAVAANTIEDSLASFSSYGAKTVHVSAPGRAILSTFKGAAYAVYSGTSMATPHTSGTLGLLLSQEGRMDFAEMKERLIKTSVPVRALKRKSASGGRVNAYNLLIDERPIRNEPNPVDWKRKNLETPFESKHPYDANSTIKKTFVVPGASYVRVNVGKYDLESRYDILRIRNPKTGELIEEISGAGQNYLTEYVEGDTVEVEMTSDYSVNNWGFIISNIEFIVK